MTKLYHPTPSLSPIQHPQPISNTKLSTHCQPKPINLAQNPNKTLSLITQTHFAQTFTIPLGPKPQPYQPNKA